MEKIFDESLIVIVRFTVLFLAGIISAKRFMNSPTPVTTAISSEQVWRERALYYKKIAYRQYVLRKQAEAKYDAMLEIVEAIGIREIVRQQRRR